MLYFLREKKIDTKFSFSLPPSREKSGWVTFPQHTHHTDAQVWQDSYKYVIEYSKRKKKKRKSNVSSRGSCQTHMAHCHQTTRKTSAESIWKSWWSTLSSVNDNTSRRTYRHYKRVYTVNRSLCTNYIVHHIFAQVKITVKFFLHPADVNRISQA